MHYSSLFSSSDSSDASSFYVVLGEWLEAITVFEISYHQLNQRVMFREPGSELLDRFIGQCSATQVLDLLAQMCNELEALVSEMDTPPSLSNLMDHTSRLRLLTNQAAVMINLLAQSNC